MLKDAHFDNEILLLLQFIIVRVICTENYIRTLSWLADLIRPARAFFGWEQKNLRVLMTAAAARKMVNYRLRGPPRSYLLDVVTTPRTQLVSRAGRPRIIDKITIISQPSEWMTYDRYGASTSVRYSILRTVRDTVHARARNFHCNRHTMYLQLNVGITLLHITCYGVIHMLHRGEQIFQ